MRVSYRHWSAKIGAVFFIQGRKTKMGKSRKDYEKYLNSISPDRDDERWIIGGKNRYCGRENYGTMIKRYDPIGFNVGYREWVEQPE